MIISTNNSKQKWHNATKPKLDHPAVSTIEVNDHEKKIYMAGDDNPDNIGRYF